jgi:predicted nuclease with TOPRIM domain
VDLQAKATHWCSQMKLAVRSDVTVMLLKVDTALNEITSLKMNLVKAHRQIEELKSSKRELCLQLEKMVPVSELQAFKADANKLREDKSGLEQELLAMKGEVSELNSKIQV